MPEDALTEDFITYLRTRRNYRPLLGQDTSDGIFHLTQDPNGLEWVKVISLQPGLTRTDADTINQYLKKWDIPPEDFWRGYLASK